MLARNELQVNEDLLAFYKTMRKEKPHLKYSLDAWILKLEEDIKGNHIHIDYLLQEYEEITGIFSTDFV